MFHADEELGIKSSQFAYSANGNKNRVLFVLVVADFMCCFGCGGLGFSVLKRFCISALRGRSRVAR